MYNEDLKKRYITEKNELVTIDKYYLPNIFKKTEPFENLLNKDLCNFTTEEIESMIKLCGFTSYNMITTFISTCSIYTNWCMNQGMVLDSQNHFLEIRPEQYSLLVNKAIYEMRTVDRDQIERWINELPNPSDRFVFLGVFEGIKGKEYSEFVDIVRDDINLDKSTIRLKGAKGEMKFSKLLCNIGIESADTMTYTPLTGKMERESKFIPSDKVIKDMANIRDGGKSKTLGRRIYFRLLRSFKYLGIDSFFDSNALQNSGMIYMIKQRSDELNITKEEYIYNHINEINLKYGKHYYPYDLIRKIGDICLM